MALYGGNTDLHELLLLKKTNVTYCNNYYTIYVVYLAMTLISCKDHQIKCAPLLSHLYCKHGFSSMKYRNLPV